MAALSLPGLAVFFPVAVFEVQSRSHTYLCWACFCEVVERGHFVLRNGFHLIIQQALLKLWCWSLCQSHHLHQCKQNRLYVMVTSDDHKYCICPPSGHVLIITCHAVKCGISFPIGQWDVSGCDVCPFWEKSPSPVSGHPAFQWQCF